MKDLRLELLEPRQLLAAYAVPSLGGASETIRISREGDFHRIEVTNGSTPVSVLNHVSTYDSITVTSFGGNDTLIIDLTGGDPLPNGTIWFSGGTGATENNVLQVTGGLESRSTRVGMANGSRTDVIVDSAVLALPDGPSVATVMKALSLNNGTVVLPAGGNVTTISALTVTGTRNALDVGEQSVVKTTGATTTSTIADNSMLTKRGSGILEIDQPQTHGVGASFLALGGRTLFNTNAGGTAENYRLQLQVSQAGTAVDFRSTQHLNSLSIDNGAIAHLTDGGPKRLWLNGLDIDTPPAGSPASQLDLGSGTMIVTYANQPNPATEVQRQLRSSHAVGGMAGSGIVSSTVRTENTVYGSTAFSELAWIDKPVANSTYLQPNNRLTTVATNNTPIPFPAVIVSYGIRGDADLSGVVNTADQTALNTGMANQGPPGASQNTWAWGDFNYDGVINATDQALLTAATTNQTTNNRAPIILTPTVPLVQQGKTLRFTVKGVDPTVKASGATPNGLTYSLVSPPAGATIQSSRGDIVWTNVPTGPQTLTVKVTQSGGGTLASANYVVSVPIANSPDLTISASGFGTSGDERGLLRVNYSLATAVAAPFNIGVFRSTVAAGTASDTRLMTYRVSDPARWAAGAHTILFRPDFTDIDADYYLVATIDAENEILETTETNNLASFVRGAFVTADGTLHVHGGDVSDTVRIEASSDIPNPMLYQSVTPTVLTTFAPDLPISSIHVRLHGGVNVYNNNLDQGNWQFRQWIYGGTANDYFTVGNVPSIIDPGAGTDSITLTGTARGDTVDIGPEGIQWHTADRTIFRNAETVTIDTAGGDDRVRYRGVPTGATSVTINGGPTVGGGDDVLDLSALSTSGVVPRPISVTGFDVVDLSHNGLAAASLVTSYFTFITDRTSLRSVDLRYNAIDLSDSTSLANVVSQLTGLQQLSLYGNPNADVGTNLGALTGKWLRVDLAPVGLAKAELMTTESAAINAIAKSLHYLPLAVYEYVLNNYRYEAYTGIMKSPLAVLQTKAGNDWDMSNFLIELLKASGLSASNLRLARNKINGNHYTRLSAEAVRSWLGTTPAPNVLYESAVDYFKVAGSRTKTYPSVGTELTALGMDHVWVEASLSGVWKPMDPSFKRSDFSSVVTNYLADLNTKLGKAYANFGELLAVEVPPNPDDTSTTNVNEAANLTELLPTVNHVDSYFNSVGSPLHLRQELIYEWYEDRVSKWLAVNAPGLTLADLKLDAVIVPRRVSSIDDAWSPEVQFVLDGTTPDIRSYANAAGVFTETFTPSDSNHHRMTMNIVKVGGNPGSQWSAAVTLNMATTSLSTVVIRRDSLNVPHLYVGGIQKSSVASGTVGVENSEQYELTVQYYRANSSTPDSVGKYRREGDTVTTIFVEANQLSNTHLFGLSAAINDKAIQTVAAAKVATPGAALTTFSADDVATFHTLAGNTYFQRDAESQSVLNGLFRTVQLQDVVGIGAVSSKAVITTANMHYDLQFPIILPDLFVDLPQSWNATLSRDPLTQPGLSPAHPRTNDAQKARSLLHGYNASALEHALWEELTNTYGMSTIRSFQIARESNIPIQTFTPSSWSSWANNPFPTAVSAAVTNAFVVNGAQTVTLPTNLTTIGVLGEPDYWSGIGFVAKYPDSVGYIIMKADGSQANGGYATRRTPPPQFNTRSVTPVFSKIVGDPVNVATGATVEDIVDISIPAVGLPLTFVRHYDSNSASQPDSDSLSGLRDLGQGWWHNFSDRLYGTGTLNAPTTPTANAPDLDWIDSQGHRYTLDRSGGAYIVPPELKGQFSYDTTTSKYLYRDRSGLGHRFNANGTLDAIVDMYGNELRMNYVSGKLSSVESFPVGSPPVEAGTTTVSKKLQFVYTGNQISSVQEILSTGAVGRVWSYTVTQLPATTGKFYLTQTQSPPALVQGSSTPITSQYAYYVTGEDPNSPRFGKLKDVIQPDSGTVHYDYYANGRAFQATDAEGFKQTFHFDLYRNRTSAYDEANNRITYSYSNGGHPTQTQYPDRSRTTQVWDEVEKRLISETDAGNLTHLYSYTRTNGTNDPYDNVWQIDTQLTTGYDATGNPIRATMSVLDSLQGGAVPVLLQDKFLHAEVLDANNRLIVSHVTKETRPGGGTVPRDTIYLYNTTSPQSLVKTIEGQLQATYYTRHASGLVLDRKQRSWQRVAGSLTNPADDTTSDLMAHEVYSYNNAGQITTKDSKVSQTSAGVYANILERTAYDARGHVTSTTNGRNITTTFAPDSTGRSASVTLPATTQLPAATAVTHFDPFGNISYFQDPVLRTTTSTYDHRQKLTKAVHPDLSLITYRYDSRGNVTASTDELGRITEYRYDTRNRRIETITPDGASYITWYDGRGNAVGTLDRLDAAGFVTAMPSSDGLVRRDSTLRFDVRGHLVETRSPDPDGNPLTDNPATTVTYRYDAVGNRLAEIDARTKTSLWQNVSHALDINNDGLVNASDATLIQSEFLLRSGALPPRTHAVAPFVDIDGNDMLTSLDVLRVINAVSAGDTSPRISGIIYEYDRLNRVTKRTEPNAADGLVDTTLLHATPVTTYLYDQQTAVLPDAPGGVGRRMVTTDALGRKLQVDYDMRGRMLTEIRLDASGNQVSKSTRTYDNADNLVTEVSPRGYVSGNSPSTFTSSYVNDSRNQRISVNLPNTIGDGGITLTHVTNFQYDQVGNLELTSTGQGADLTYTLLQYDARDRVVTSKRPIDAATPTLEQVITSAYDVAGNIVQVTDPLGRVTRTEFDVMNRPVLLTDALGNRATLQYTTTGQVMRRVDTRGNAWLTSYDLLDRRVRQVDADPDGSGTAQSSRLHYYWYNVAGDLAQEAESQDVIYVSGVQSVDQMAASRTTTYIYDRLGRLVQRHDPDPDLYQPVTLLPKTLGTITSNGTLTSPITVYRYNALGNKTLEVGPRGTFADGTYNSLYQTDYDYDALNRLKTMTEPDSDYNPNNSTNGPDGRPVWQYQYDVVGNLEWVIDPLNRKTSHTYDAVNLKLSTRDYALATDTVPKATVSWAYDDRGNVIKEVDAVNVTTRYQYDLLDRVIVADGQDVTTGGITYTHISTTTYDLANNMTLTKDSAGRQTRYVYDGLNRRIQTLLPTLAGDMRQSVVIYDAQGNVVRAVDSLGQVTKFSYDNANRLTTTTDPNGDATAVTFDLVGNRSTVTDARGIRTRYKYDLLDRLTHEGIRTGVNAGNDVYSDRTLTYDAASNITTITDRGGRIRTFEYDLLDRETKEIWSGAANTIVSTWDVAGQLKSLSDSYATYTYTYDFAGRPLTETVPTAAVLPVVRLDYEYYPNGERSVLQDAIGGGAVTQRFTWDLDARGRTRRITNATTSDLDVIDLTYNQSDQLAAVTRTETCLVPPCQTIPHHPTTSYRYEAATGRLAQLQHSIGVGNSSAFLQWTRKIDAFDYQYDRDDRLVRWDTLMDGSSTYAHDKIDQLLTADRTGTVNDETYGYDDVGNRTNSTLSGASNVLNYGTAYDQNRLQSDSTYTYSYDAEGNRTARNKASAPTEYVTYTWDHRQRLTNVTYRGSLGGAITKQVDFTYDAWDRRIRKVVDLDGPGGPLPATTEKTVYQGDEAYLQFDGSNQLTHRYVHGPAVDQALLDYDFTAGATSKWLLTDHENSVRDVVDMNGVELNHKAYDSFGRQTTETNTTAAADAVFGYTGRQFDAETGLQYNRARYYDPQVGRFLSSDPSGLEAGDVNLYRYAGNNPLTQTDPTGHIKSAVSGALNFAKQTYSAVSEWIGTKGREVTNYNQSSQRATTSGQTSLNALRDVLSPGPSYGPTVPRLPGESENRYMYRQSQQDQAWERLNANPVAHKLVFEDAVRDEERRQFAQEQHAAHGSIGASDPYQDAQLDKWAEIQRRYTPQQIANAQWQADMQNAGYSQLTIALASLILPKNVTNAAMNFDDVVMAVGGFTGLNPINPRNSSTPRPGYNWGSPTVQLPLTRSDLGYTAIGSPAPVAPIKALTQSEQAAMRKIANIESGHLKPHDFTGTLRDMVGNPVPKKTGGYWDHAQEMNNSLQGLRKHVNTLRNSTDPAAVAAWERAEALIKKIVEFTEGAGL